MKSPQCHRKHRLHPHAGIRQSGGILLSLFLFASIAAVARPAAAQQAAPPRAQLQMPTTPYRLQVGDTLDIFYRFTPEYNQTVTVLPDGTVALQLLGSLHLAGLDLQQAHDALVALAQTRLKNPELSLSLKDFEKSTFVVLGEVSKPGKYELHGQLNAVDALATAGGFTSNSSQGRVILVRRLSSNSDYGEAAVIDFKKLRHLNASTEMPLMRNGDILIVSTSRFAKVERIVKLANPGLYYPLPTF
jgi:polysaccharide export outer membrane protein